MYVYGGNHNGRYLSDLQVYFILCSLTNSFVQFNLLAQLVDLGNHLDNIGGNDFYCHLTVYPSICVANEIYEFLSTLYILQVLDLRRWTWSRVEVKAGVETDESKSSVSPIPCAGHVLVCTGAIYCIK